MARHSGHPEARKRAAQALFGSWPARCCRNVSRLAKCLPHAPHRGSCLEWLALATCAVSCSAVLNPPVAVRTRGLRRSLGLLRPARRRRGGRLRVAVFRGAQHRGAGFAPRAEGVVARHANWRLAKSLFFQKTRCLRQRCPETHAILFGVSEKRPPPNLVASGTTWTTRRRGPHRASLSHAHDTTASSSLSSPPKPPPPPNKSRDMCAVACPTWIRHPCCILFLTIVSLCAVAVVIRLLAMDPSNGIPPARRLLFDESTTRFADDAPRGGPRRALLFSPLKPVTGFLPAEPYEFSSWSSGSRARGASTSTTRPSAASRRVEADTPASLGAGKPPSRTRAKTRKTRSKREAVCDQKHERLLYVKSRSIVVSLAPVIRRRLRESRCRPSRSKPTRDHVVTSKHRGDGFDDRLGALDRRSTRARASPSSSSAKGIPRPAPARCQIATAA